MGRFATGVTIVTTHDRLGRPYGVTVNAFTSVSLDPTLVLVCLDQRLSGLKIFLDSRKFGVNILKRDQREISDHFATHGTDRSRWITATGKSGVPLLDRTLAFLECRLAQTFEVGDHVILVGEVLEGDVSDDSAEPLLYFQGRYRDLKQPPRGS